MIWTLAHTIYFQTLAHTINFFSFMKSSDALGMDDVKVVKEAKLIRYW